MSSALLGTNSFWAILLVVFLRYLILASIAYGIFYVLKRESWRFKRIQQKFPSTKDYGREIGYSVLTAFIFAAVGYATFSPFFIKYTLIYTNLEKYGTLYFWLSIFLMIVFHDTYFYWTHWLMHRKSIYKFVHRTHHLSTNPSPWAAMSFHPLEALISALVVVFIAVLIPFHPLALGIFLLFMMVYNVYGHLGYELYPKRFAGNFIGQWINTSVNHNLHHQTFKGNYGLYFLFWDRVMGTIQKEYETAFDEVTTRRDSKPAIPMPLGNK